MAQVNSEAVKKLLDEIEAEVKPQLMPFYACDCPRGHKGIWRKKSGASAKQEMPNSFDPLALTPKDRADYEYAGPEVIYTFWAKHGPCQATGCGHRTPIMSSPVIAVKELSVKTWTDMKCPKCYSIIDIEAQEVRMAPAAMYYDCEDTPHAALKKDRSFICPLCLKTVHEGPNFDDGEISYKQTKQVNKKVQLTLLIHPDWLKGAPGKDQKGNSYGGSATDDAESTAAWNTERAKTLKLIEVRGKLPEKMVAYDTKEEFYTNHRGGTVPKKANFKCQKCGREQSTLDSIKKSGKTGPVAMYAIQGYCPASDNAKIPYGGRFFDVPNTNAFSAAAKEWEIRRDTDLEEFWAKSELSFGWKTHGWAIPEHGYAHYWTMFNSRQLFGLALLLKQILGYTKDQSAKDFVLGAFQQYVRNQSMFCIWNWQRDTLEPMMSKNNYYPPATSTENSVFSKLGRGNWLSSSGALLEVIDWSSNPWERLAVSELAKTAPTLVKGMSAKSVAVYPGDPVLNRCELSCGSSSELAQLKESTFDLVITDPPFGDLMQYAELSDFFYVWLRLALKDKYPAQFGLEYTPKDLEAVANKARHPDDPDAFYQNILTECWREVLRILKPGGILAFTFHHSQDEPWLNVLRSLFDAGFYLEATFPIRSDETKGENAEFGSQKIEFDIIHVCRKRLVAPVPISWAKLRQQIVGDIAQLKTMLEHHTAAGLPEADLQVIRRGKALEYFSKYYGKVYTADGEPFDIRKAILGINQILDDQRSLSRDAPPVTAEPFTREFLRLFIDTDSLPRDQMQKFLRGTGISPAEFVVKNWCSDANKCFTLTPPLEFAKAWTNKHRRNMRHELDQALFLLGACHAGSGINVKETLANANFNAHPALADVLEWFTKHGCDATVKDAARLALKLFKGSVAEKSIKPEEQPQLLFDGN